MSVPPNRYHDPMDWPRPGLWIATGLLLLSVGCGPSGMEDDRFLLVPNDRKDAHSYSNPEQVRLTRVELDLDVSFESKTLSGSATLVVKRVVPDADELILDTRELDIREVETAASDGAFVPARFEVGEHDPILGAPLTIQLPPETSRVRVHYATRPGASALQWLEPAQTAGKKHPFLYTQSQAIHARSWIPLQDTPGVRVSYGATIRTPVDLFAVMSAEMEARSRSEAPSPGQYRFQMPQAIPSYLIALAVGDLVFKPMGERTGVYAEPGVVERAAKEFEDTERMIETVEQLYGPYRWQRYDILVLPPSFPFGGMENPRLTFATPTILTGDKSLVSLVAHELAHSWSGNLVTNATWRDFWLNEGFTVYLENRIQEAVYGVARANMELALEAGELHRELRQLEARDQVLYINLDGRDPDAGFTGVPYVKGALFLRALEEAAGRERFDAFLRGYFDHFSFQSVTTADFLAYLEKHLANEVPDLIEKVPLKKWLLEPGLPENAPVPESDAFQAVERAATSWAEGAISASEIPTREWTTQEWLHFLRSLPADLQPSQMKVLDATCALTVSENSEILFQWLLISIRNNYEPAYPRVETFLTTVGRRKFLKPLYSELVKTEEGKSGAAAIYRKARPLYHPIAVATIDEIVGWDQ